MVKRVLVSGQSNAIGRGAGGPAYSTISSLVRIWNNKNPTNPAGSDPGNGWVSPVVANLPPLDEGGDRNFGVFFADKMARELDEAVDLMVVAQGDTNISEWVGSSNATGPQLTRIFNNWTASGQGPADVFLWHHGEFNVDAGTTFATYAERFNQMIVKLKASGVINDSTIIVLGGLGENTSARILFNSDCLRALASQAPERRYASSAGLLPLQDASHFTGGQLFTLGAERMWDAYVGVAPLPMIPNLYALINEDGIPGNPGTGQNKSLNLKDTMGLRIGVKNVTDPPEYPGGLPGGNILTAAMIAAGAIVDYGHVSGKGWFIRWESGLQICFSPALTMTYSTASLLVNNWEFAQPFVYVPTPGMTPSAVVAANNMASAKRGPSMPDVGTVTTLSAEVRLTSNALYTGGNETFGAYAWAFGLWKDPAS